MSILDQDPKGYYDKIVDEQDPQKKSFNLLLAILVVVLFAFGGTVYYLKSDQSDLKQENIQLETKIQTLQDYNLTYERECQSRMEKARVDQKAEDDVKYNKLEDNYYRDISKWQDKVDYVTRELLKRKSGK